MANKILRIDPKLAVEIGFNESIVLKQLEFLLKLESKSKNGKKNGFDDKDDNHWTYQDYDSWTKKDFPYWSPRTLRRSLKNLKQKDLVITSQRKYDVLYRINLGTYETLKEKLRVAKLDSLVDKMASLDGQDGQSPATTENTSESTSDIFANKKNLTTKTSGKNKQTLLSYKDAANSGNLPMPANTAVAKRLSLEELKSLGQELDYPMDNDEFLERQEFFNDYLLEKDKVFKTRKQYLAAFRNYIRIGYERNLHNIKVFEKGGEKE